jgi:hypothetical protein
VQLRDVAFPSFADGSTGTAAGYNVRLFPSEEPGAVRGFGAAVLPRAAIGEYGVCVLAGDNSRTACARVSITRTSSHFPHITLEPLKPDVPLVAKPVNASAYTGTVYPPVRPRRPGGVCATSF